MINGTNGIGKTNTIQNFAIQMAKPFISWTCRGGASYESLSRIFKAVAMGGFWVCIDDMNQLELELISRVVDFMSKLREGIMSGATKLTLDYSEETGAD